MGIMRLGEHPRQIKDPSEDVAWYGEFFVATNINGEPETYIESRRLNLELREDDQLWVEPDDTCGVHYVFNIHEVKAQVDALVEGTKAVKPDRVKQQELEAKLEQAELKAERAESRRDDSELRIKAAAEWADQEGHRSQLDSCLAGITPTR